MEHPFRNRPIIKNMEKTFKQKILKYTAKQIAEKVGCPMPTAYDWKSGRRSPPYWVQDLLLEHIEKTTKEPQIKAKQLNISKPTWSLRGFLMSLATSRPIARLWQPPS
jgi:hypothetical protein